MKNAASKIFRYRGTLRREYGSAVLMEENCQYLCKTIAYCVLPCVENVRFLG